MLGLNIQPHSRPFQREARSIDLKLRHGKTEFTKVLFLCSDISTPVHKCLLWLGGGHLGTEGDPRWVPITTLSAGTKWLHHGVFLPNEAEFQGLWVTGRVPCEFIKVRSQRLLQTDWSEAPMTGDSRVTICT